MSYRKEDFIKDLENMGLDRRDALMVHSSFKSVGEVEGGADTVVDALMEYFSEGLLMMPTHTWKQMGEQYPVFNPQTEEACVGIIPNRFRIREGVVRSLHPTHSIAAYGKDAAEYVKGEELLKTPCAPNGCWGRLADINAKILLLGVTHIRNTYIHAIEEIYDVPGRLTEKPVLFYVEMPDGNQKEVPMHRHYSPKTPHISESFDKMLAGYFAAGACKEVAFGDAKCILCDAKKLLEVTGKILTKEPGCFLDRENIPTDWYI